MVVIAWVLAVILAVWGVLDILSSHLLWGIILLVAACLVGPGGYSVFRRGSNTGV